MARHPFKSPAIFLVCLLLVSVFPIDLSQASSDNGAQSRSHGSNYATSFIHEYNITGDGRFEYLIGGLENPMHKLYAYDDAGNLYLVLSGQSGSFAGYPLTPEGLHIVKITATGALSWGKSISLSTNDNEYLMVEAIEILGEDEFYISFAYTRNYQTTLTFSSTVTITTSGTLSSSHDSFVVAYHNATSGWMWADSDSYIGSSSKHAYNFGLDSNDNYIITHSQGSYDNQNYNFSINSYSRQGLNWAKSLVIEEPYYSLQMDIEGTNLHFFSMFGVGSGDGAEWTFDGQNTDCTGSTGPQGEDSFGCILWLTLNSNGGKISSITKPNPWAFFTTFSVRQGDAYISGIMGGDYDQHNFTGTPTSFNTDDQYGFATKINSNGVWGYLHEWIIWHSDFQPLQDFRMFVHDNGSVTHMIHQKNTVTFNTATVGMLAQMSEQISLVTFDSQGAYQFHNSIGITGPNDIVWLSGYLDEHNGYFCIYIASDTMQRFGNYYSSTYGSDHGTIIWYSAINGSILDFETSLPANDYYFIPLLSSPDGDTIIHQYDGYSSTSLAVYSVDTDGDDIGSTDNCPDDYNPLQEDYDSDATGDVCDDDDDADTIPDLVDSCSMGEKGWVSNSVTDHDSDGCKDVHAEDPDDDNDGLSDQFDSCPVGITGTGGDHDGDGCKDAEDSDDDNDLIGDGSDYCSQGNVGWLSGEVTDYDSDGCRDDIEDDDDDNDGVLDTSDQCPRGELDWKSNINTDFDGDGCRDSVEDVDDDADGVNNPYDDCPYSIGEVDEAGCSAQQYLNSGGNQSMPSIFYVCEGGTAVVLDLDDCPEHSGGEGNNSSENNSGGENQTENNDTMLPSIYFVCEGGKAIVLNYSDCPEVESETEQNQSNLNFDNITLVLSTNTTLPEGFALCPSGKAIVVDMADCPEYQNTNNNISSNDGVSSGSSGDDDLVTTMVYASFLLALIAVLIVLIRRPVVQSASPLIYDETSQFSEEKNTMIPIFDSPPLSLKGVPNEGFEWIEYPDNSDQHWFRPLDSNGAWTKHV